jgi:xylan 1,4-beta-xylosidase
MPSFRNPILAGFHPDPSICRVRDDFYLVTSSFEYFPGVPIFHSRDLVHWQPIGHVLTRQSQLDLGKAPSSGGIYAPTLRYRKGRFYMVTTHVFGGGNFYVTANNPEGPWSDPVWVDKEGIDPSFFFDGDALYYTRNGKGKDRDHPIIYQTTLDPKTGKMEGPLKPIWKGTGGVWPEGPHLYKVGTTYYLLTAEGGTGNDHSVVVGRSLSPSGPFDPCPRNPILTHRHRRGHPIQATGHADLVELEDGSHWAVFLGVRPRRGHHHLGRETFLAPVTWTSDGWPRIGADGRVEMQMSAPLLSPRPWSPPAARDNFDRPKLSPAWNFLRNPVSRDWSLTRRRGFLRLVGSSVTLDDIGAPAFVGRRQQHFRVRCRAMLEFSPGQPNEEAGLTVRANENFRFDLAVRLGAAGRVALLRSRTRGRSRVVACEAIANGPVQLEVRASDDRYVFTANAGHQSVRLGDLPARSLSAESIGRYGQRFFTGVYIGMYATGNGQRSGAHADFDWFEYAPSAAGLRSP